MSKRKNASETAPPPVAAIPNGQGRYAILDGVMEGCQVIAPDWRYIYVNAAAAAQWHLRVEDFQGRKLPELFPESATTPGFQMLARCLRERVSAQFENELKLRDGQKRTFVLSVHPAPDGVLLFSWDITERKAAEMALRESEQRYRELFDDAPVGYHEVNTDGVITRVNHAEARLLGYKVEEMAGRPVWDFILNRDESERVVREKLAGTRPLQGYERRYVRKDGSEVDLYIQEHLIRTADGAITGLRSVVHDVTRSKRVEAELRESQRALMTLMSNLPGMAYRCRNDSHWTMEFVSEGCVDLTGYQPADLIGNRRISYAEIIHPEDRDEKWKDVQTGLMEGRPFSLVYRIRVARGEERWVSENGRGVRSAQGELVALEGFIADITEQKRAEEQLRASEQKHRDLAQKLEHDASHDPLTGCYNRRCLLTILDSEVARARRHRRPLSLALLDVDLMKQVNDNFGHDAGDAALCLLTRVVMAAKRGADSLVRWGGDEFILIMPDTTAEQARRPTERIRQLFREEFKNLSELPREAQELGVGVSIGVVEHQRDEAVRDLVRRADAMMYAEKRHKAK